MSAKLRVQFAHGLEGSPEGSKARLLAASYDALTPAMDTSDFEACVNVHARAAREFRPAVVVGSSFGGAVLLALLQRRLWRGPSLLLAHAGLRYGLAAELPQGVDIWVVHGVRDEVIDADDSRRLAAAGDPACVRLILVDDDHALRNATASGQLLGWIDELTRTASPG